MPIDLLQPQIPGGRRVVPLLAGPTVVEHLATLLDQDRYWVSRSRWQHWLATGDEEHTVPIGSMTGDDRLAALAWLRQQRHVLHRTLVGACVRAPDGWIEDRPLYRALRG